MIRDALVSLLTSFLLAVATLSGWLHRLTGWADLTASRWAVAASRLHTRAWRQRKEEERFERVSQQR